MPLLLFKKLFLFAEISIVDDKDEGKRQKVPNEKHDKLSHKVAECFPIVPFKDTYVPGETYEVAQREDQEYAEQKVDLIFELRNVFVKVSYFLSEAVD